jgi:serine/threonine protein kinase
MSKPTRSAPTEHPKLGKYEVLREVGRSTTAIVYEGHDPYIDRPVALKMALKRLPDDRDLAERFRRRFFREAQTAGGLRHPNIVQVFDAGVHGDRCYIVMEYVSHGATSPTRKRIISCPSSGSSRPPSSRRVRWSMPTTKG